MFCESYRRSDDHADGFIYRRSNDHADGFERFCSPTIRRSHLGFFAESYRRSDDHNRVFLRKLPTIRRSNSGFFAESYRRSDDHISVFFPKVTDDPTIKFRFFSESYRRSDDNFRVFPAITWRWHQRIGTFNIFRNLPMIRWSDFRRSSLRFIFEFTDDPTIILYQRSDDHFFDYFYRRSDDHLKDFYRRSDDHEYGFLAKSYRQSDDHNMDFLAKVNDDPTITVPNFVPDSCQNWNPDPSDHFCLSKYHHSYQKRRGREYTSTMVV